MSASLVGSEMCIRDRDSGRAREPRPRPDRDTRAQPVKEVVLRVAGLPHAVSYTHLTLPTICSV
eukprot:7899263-Alexandrium_andersonii.AAC.1